MINFDSNFKNLHTPQKRESKSQSPSFIKWLGELEFTKRNAVTKRGRLSLYPERSIGEPW